MIRKLFLFLLLLDLTGIMAAQSFSGTEELFRRGGNDSGAGKLRIIQNPAIDTLLSKYILAQLRVYNDVGYNGMDGYRIQIYSSSNRNAREESGKARAEFISRFPGIASYLLYADPGYFKVRVGNFRTKTEAYNLFLRISNQFPDAYIVPDIINFPDQNIK